TTTPVTEPPGGGTNTTTPATTAPPATSPPDTTAPSVGVPVVSPSTVACGSSATVTVSVTDPSGVGTVTLRLSGFVSLEKTMTSQGGSTYSASTGPLASQFGGPVAVVVTAVDQRGNGPGNNGTTFTLSC
ncbi:MAG: hypothetical protein ACRD12_06400, partial [Acidimicrobiales bacterium]